MTPRVSHANNTRPIPYRRLLLVVVLLAGCSREKAAKPDAVAKVANPVTEAQLTTVTLSPEAIARLGIATAVVESILVTPTRMLGGEILAPPGEGVVLTAPFAGTILAPEGAAAPQAGSRVSRGQPVMRIAALPPDRDLMRTREDLEAARARLIQAQQEADRTARLAAEQLVSVREQERAQADLVAAAAAAAAAEAQWRLVTQGATNSGAVSALVITAPTDGTILSLSATPGQTVAAGAPLISIVALDRLWVRVPMFAGEATAVDRSAEATLQLLGEEQSAAAILRAVPVMAPPTADPVAASVDLYYAIAGGGQRLRPGQRVSVAVPMIASGRRELTIPFAAVLHDVQGGAWVYERTDSVTFVRRRVELVRMAGAMAILARGPAAGTVVVTAGAAELFGVEFGPGK